MALIACPECNKQISNSATSCPHCGFPLQSDVNQTADVSNSQTCQHKAESHRRKKKTRTILSVVLSTVVCILACVILIFIYGPNQENNKDSTEPKDKDYLYNWLTEHGTLVDGTSLQYAGTDENGNRFTLCYNTSNVEKFMWQVYYSTKDTSGRTIATTLFLFSDSDKSQASISVYGAGTFDDYYRDFAFYHNKNTFAKNSPIERGNHGGSTVTQNIFIPGQGPATIVDDTPGLQTMLNRMDSICENNAQKNLCLILDWLKESFCKTAKMKMSDFGYNRY